MFFSLPPELVRMIAKSCPLRTQASVAGTCKRLYEICNPTLYLDDVKNHGSSSVFHAIAQCTDELVALGTLKAAASGGADFKQCQDFYGTRSFLLEPSQIAVHSPLCLAASRGLNCVVSFLLDRGLSADGPEGVVTPPLFQAIANRQELTAAWLVTRGASLARPDLPRNALQAAMLNSLPSLTSYLVKWTSLDINEKAIADSFSIVLALRSRQPSMVPHIISLGAEVKEPIWQLCRDHDWTCVVGLLDAGSIHLARALGAQGCLDVTIFVATQKVTGGYKDLQLAVIDRIITLQGALESDSQRQQAGLSKEVSDMLEGLLQRMLSIDRADLQIASLLLRHGVRIQPGIYIDLLDVLGLFKSNENRQRFVYQHRKILKSFDFIFSHCSSIPSERRDAAMDYFLRKVPTQAVKLVHQMKSQGLPLTAHSLRRMENGTPDGEQSQSS